MKTENKIDKNDINLEYDEIGLMYMTSTLELFDIAQLFGTNEENLSKECKSYILNNDFRFRRTTNHEREQLYLNILKTINSGSLTVSGSNRKEDWETGWSENLYNYENNNELHELVPKFFKSKGVIRLNNNYVIPLNEKFEINLYNTLRMYLFQKYFNNIKNVYEFGCGTGLNLIGLSEIFPNINLYGLDWTEASVKIINKIGTHNKKMKGMVFDMFKPNYDIKLDDDSAIFTVGTLEQLGTKYEDFLQYLLNQKPKLCINIETMYELYNQHDLFDYVSIMYLEKRNYLKGYLTRLRQLEKEGKIEIIDVKRTFGGYYHDGYSFIIWRPINEE